MKMLNGLKRSFGFTKVFVAKHSPAILTGVGVVGVVTAGVLACKATLKAKDISDEYKQTKEEMNSLIKKNVEEYTKNDYDKDNVLLHVQTAVKFAKVYAPSVILGAVSIASIIWGHKILKKRNLALVGMYKALDVKFKEYRERVAESVGKEQELSIFNGTKKITKLTGINEECEVVKPVLPSIYSRFFDEFNVNWQTDPTYNLLFLRSVQQYCNDLLRARGHLFLNEVYSQLGMEHSKAGALVGWVFNTNHDGYVDFGIYDETNPIKVDFVAGRNNAILLDFNVDGVIYDLL